MAGFFKIPGESSDGDAANVGNESTGSQQGAPAERNGSPAAPSVPLFHIPGSAPAAGTGDGDVSSDAHVDSAGVDAGTPRVDDAVSKTGAGNAAEPSVGDTARERPVSPFAGAFRLHTGGDAGAHDAGTPVAGNGSGETGTAAPRPANPFSMPAVDRDAGSQRAGIDVGLADRDAGPRGAVSTPSGSDAGPASGQSRVSAVSTFRAPVDGSVNGGGDTVPSASDGSMSAAPTPTPRPALVSNGEHGSGNGTTTASAGHAPVSNGPSAGDASAPVSSAPSAWSPDSFLDVGAGFDPGWSGTVGAGEDAPAFTGGGFLDLGDEDEDESFDDGDGGADDGYHVGDYVPSGDGETAGFVSDDGTVVHGDLDLPQSWKATTTHDPGDDGQQSVAWNKDGKAAAVKPSEERLTVVKRYHKATKEEMRVRREVAEQVALQGGLPDEGGALIDPRSAKPVRGSSAATGGSGDSEIDEKALRFGVKVGTGKAKLEKRLRNKHDVDAAIARRVQVLEWKKGFHVTFGAKEVRGLDYLTRWSYATTAQIARVVGWRDRKERRLVRALEKWEEMGWVRQDVVFSGPRLWYPRRDGAELSEHAWLGGVSPARVNPMSQSHSLGLSSIASWLLCGWEDAPDILQLGEQEWRQLQADVKAGEALVISEKEYRAPWTRIRQTHKGLLPAEYRHAFIGDIAHGGEGRYQQWARDYQAGKAKLEDSPDWVACDPSLQGDDMWIWTLWSNYVWNPKLALDAARMDGVDVDDVDRAAQLAAIRDYRGSGYVPVEDRLDLASNKPLVNKEMGDAFALLDHLPDLIIARKRDPRTGAARSVAIELELTAKQPADYARSMAGFGSALGQTLFSQVVWVVPSKAVARAIELGARSVGLEEGVDYRIVPFASAEKRNSFWSGADIVPAVFDKYHRVQPLIDPGTFLLS